MLSSGPLAAQDSTQGRRGAVSGVVFDSVARSPLVHAVVQIVSRDSARLFFSTETDSVGHFRIADVPSGQYVLGFYHEALAALGLDAPLRPFELEAAAELTIDIGIPSAPVVYSLRCGEDKVPTHNGMLAGLVRRSDGSRAPAAATVTVEWRAIALDEGALRTVWQRAAAAVDTDGSYRLCAVPADAPLRLRVSGSGHRAILGQVLVPPAGVSRLDFRLVDSSVARGTGRLVGRVVHENGKSVISGRATIAALELDVPVKRGAFILSDLPSGTWVVEVRSIGLAPQTVFVDVAAGRVSSTATLTMSDRAQELEAVTVVGTPSREGRILEDVLRRQRSSFGTVFLRGNVHLQNADRIANVLAAARGFRYRGPNNITGRSSVAGCTGLRVYLNGEPFPAGLEGLDDLVRVRDVLAVEAYPDVSFAPVEWRISNGCSVVAVWTMTLPR